MGLCKECDAKFRQNDGELLVSEMCHDCQVNVMREIREGSLEVTHELGLSWEMESE